MENTARILVIEDNADNLELMVDLLEAFGYAPLTARNGLTGLETAISQRPDLIICDVHLPKLDGYAILSRLKNDPDLRMIPVLAVTALAMVGDRDRMLAAGFDGYISKPIEPESFVHDIEAFLPAMLRAGTPPAVAGGTAVHAHLVHHPPGGRGTILVIDDTPANIDVIRATLEPAGYAVLGAGGVDEAIHLAHDHPPDAILCDMHMDPADGREMLRVTRATKHLAHIPFAIISATCNLERETRDNRAFGSVTFIRRPIGPRELIAEVDALFTGNKLLS